MKFINFLSSFFSSKKTKSRNDKTKKRTPPAGRPKIKLKTKKTQNFTSKPIDEDSLGFGISVNGHSEHASRRKAFRVSLKGLKVRCEPLGGLLETLDISALGIGFKYSKRKLKLGITIKLDIVYKSNIKAEQVACKIMRHEQGVVGCQFLAMERQQEDAVHELVVIGQKEMGERRKQKKDKNWKPTS